MTVSPIVLIVHPLFRVRWVGPAVNSTVHENFICSPPNPPWGRFGLHTLTHGLTCEVVRTLVLQRFEFLPTDFQFLESRESCSFRHDSAISTHVVD